MARTLEWFRDDFQNMSDVGGDAQSSIHLAEEALQGLCRSVMDCPQQHRRLARDVEDAASLAVARMRDVSAAHVRIFLPRYFL